MWQIQFHICVQILDSHNSERIIQNRNSRGPPDHPETRLRLRALLMEFIMTLFAVPALDNYWRPCSDKASPPLPSLPGCLPLSSLPPSLPYPSLPSPSSPVPSTPSLEVGLSLRLLLKLTSGSGRSTAAKRIHYSFSAHFYGAREGT